jgi:glutaminyl-peptide cyclotransferase
VSQTPRVDSVILAESTNNTFVRNYLIDTMKKLKWHVEEDAFDMETPYGRKHFVNVIATKDPQASRRFVVAAHFDSKFFPTFPANQVCAFLPS